MPKPLITSPTQHETLELCRRKWFMANVLKLPQPDTKATVFGSVLHSVVERHIAADALGRDEKGNPVDLYPDGWHIARNRYDASIIEGEVSPDEQDRIKRLVQAAIDEGLLQRPENQHIEKNFRFTIGQFAAAPDAEPVTVMITGLIDLLAYDNRQDELIVTDHKTTGNMRWAKSPNELEKNLQVLIYAMAGIRELGLQDKPPQEIKVRHNVFCKDPDDLRVRRVEKSIELPVIQQAWEQRVLVNSQEMVRLRETVTDPFEVPDPENMAKACNAYGGCAYATICTGRESVEGYRQRYERKLENKPQPRYGVTLPPMAGILQKGKGADMSFASRIAMKKQQQAAGANSAAPAINPPPPSQQPQAVPAPVAAPPAAAAVAPAAVAPAAVAPAAVAAAAPADNSTPPWFKVGCAACSSTTPGFNSKGVPCRICDLDAQRNGRPTSNMFVVDAVGDGTYVWEPRQATDATAAGSGSAPTATAHQTVKVQEKVAPPPAPALEPAPAPEPASTPAAASDEDDGGIEDAISEASSSGRGRGRPKKSFSLLVNAAVTKGHSKQGSGRFVIHLSDVLKAVGEAMAKEAGVESYYQINAFERRDQLLRHGETIAESFGCDMVVASGIGTGQSDLRTLFDAIRPFAGIEIVAEAL